jgi:hypothetical protein
MANMIFKKMVEVAKDIGAIGKDQKNAAQGFKFRGIDQFVNALYPALTKNGVFMTTEVVAENHELKEVERSSGKKGVDKHVHLTMKYTFWAEDGSSVSSTIASEGLDSGDKATNKALSAALKYALIQTFSIPTEDMEEADRESPTMGAVPVKTAEREPVQMEVRHTPTPVAAEAPAKPKSTTFRNRTGSIPLANGSAPAAAPAARDGMDF